MIQPITDEINGVPEVATYWRVLTFATDEKDAKEKAAKLNELGLPCHIELFVIGGNDGRVLGEIVLQRTFFAAAFVRDVKQADAKENP